mmetsp:Transcript_29638/g.58162  ORF Transcript_29638/g.58162 Transcript_29638/m.58162 type:complete len:85 (+) Transcript_29638:2112-2366(+)
MRQRREKRTIDGGRAHSCVAQREKERKKERDKDGRGMFGQNAQRTFCGVEREGQELGVSGRRIHESCFPLHLLIPLILFFKKDS